MRYSFIFIYCVRAVSPGARNLALRCVRATSLLGGRETEYINETSPWRVDLPTYELRYVEKHSTGISGDIYQHSTLLCHENQYYKEDQIKISISISTCYQN